MGTYLLDEVDHPRRPVCQQNWKLYRVS